MYPPPQSEQPVASADTVLRVLRGGGQRLAHAHSRSSPLNHANDVGGSPGRAPGPYRWLQTPGPWITRHFFQLRAAREETCGVFAVTAPPGADSKHRPPGPEPATSLRIEIVLPGEAPSRGLSTPPVTANQFGPPGAPLRPPAGGFRRRGWSRRCGALRPELLELLAGSAITHMLVSTGTNSPASQNVSRMTPANRRRTSKDALSVDDIGNHFRPRRRDRPFACATWSTGILPPCCPAAAFQLCGHVSLLFEALDGASSPLRGTATNVLCVTPKRTNILLFHSVGLVGAHELGHRFEPRDHVAGYSR